jgi:tetratricopeptide (TPR) repeat protein
MADDFGTSRTGTVGDSPARNSRETPDARLTFLAICLSACTACTHEIQTTSGPAPVPAVHAVMVRQAKNAAEAGDGDFELRRLRQFLAANPKNPDARVLLARYYEAHGYPDLALEHYRLAAAQFPESPVIAISLAKTLRGMDGPTEAVRALQEFAARQPRPGWDVLSLEGILQDEQGNHTAAESAHRAAVAAAPEKSDLHNNLGYNLLAQGRMDAAIEEFRRAVELDPKSDIAHNNLAAALARSGSATKDTAREAIAEWSRSTGQAEAHNNMAAVLIDQGRYEEARAELAAALSMEPGLGAATSNLRLLAEKDGHPASIPAPASHARKRVSVWARIFGRHSESKPAVPGSQVDTPTDGAQANTALADTLVKK